jgi:hypothetical protein
MATSSLVVVLVLICALVAVLVWGFGRDKESHAARTVDTPPQREHDGDSGRD